MRRTWWALAAALALPGIGCTLFDRESYSLVIRKDAHIYEPRKPWPPLVPADEDREIAQDVSTMPRWDGVRDDLDALIQDAAPKTVPFQPFRYCHLHQSSHVVESVFAFALAPVEYPLAITTHIVTRPIILGFEGLLGPVTVEEEEKAKPK